MVRGVLEVAYDHIYFNPIGFLTGSSPFQLVESRLGRTGESEMVQSVWLSRGRDIKNV